MTLSVHFQNSVKPALSEHQLESQNLFPTFTEKNKPAFSGHPALLSGHGHQCQ